MRHPDSIQAVVTAGLCIGCGLCEALAPSRWRMMMTPEGRLRPARLGEGGDSGSDGTDGEILAVCPGATVSAPPVCKRENDPVWGAFTSMSRAWAADPDTRFRAATGGVLTAMGAWLLASGRARFVLQCVADPDAPMRTMWTISETPEAVIRAAGSRYGPSDTLAGLEHALARAEPFAVIAKPCDASALHARARHDPRLAEQLVAVLVMVCGGASELGKSQALLAEYGLAEQDLTLFRYRGYGNPGRTRVETKDGRAFEKTYQELWADEGTWRIQTRCKLCPDAIGEAADIAAADIWPGGTPEGEDAGFNGVICRTARGQALFEAALADGALNSDIAMTPRDFDECQPHQVAKKRAVAARLRGIARAGSPVYAHENLRIDELDAQDAAEADGAEARVRSGRFTEPMPEIKETDT